MSWPFDPTVYAGLLALCALYAWLARSAGGAGLRQPVYFALGIGLMWLALETPIDTAGDRYLDSVHMLQHVLLGFVAPPLLLLGLTPRMVDRLVAVPGIRGITEPVQAQIFAGLVMIGWHLPPLYDATLASESLHVFEHLTFIAAGLALYWPMLEATSAGSRWRMSPGAKLLYMLVATLPQDGVALALIFSRVVFYAYYAHAPRLVPGLTPIIDQTVAGALLMVLGKATMAVAALAVYFRWFGDDRRADQAVEPGPAVN